LRTIESIEKRETYPELTVVLDRFLIIFFHVVREVINGDVIVFNVLHDLKENVNKHKVWVDRVARTLFLKPRSSLGVKESALPMTGITLTRGDSRRINSMSISRKLKNRISNLQSVNSHTRKLTYA
jgi:hypothetical protein